MCAARSARVDAAGAEVRFGGVDGGKKKKKRKGSVVLWKNVHLLKDFLWLRRPPPPTPCCRGRRSAADFGSTQRQKKKLRFGGLADRGAFCTKKGAKKHQKGAFWPLCSLCVPTPTPLSPRSRGSEPKAGPRTVPAAAPGWARSAGGPVLPREIPRQGIMVCWKSRETIKYHLGSFTAPRAAFGERRFA